jgi:hypothetical protein
LCAPGEAAAAETVGLETIRSGGERTSKRRSCRAVALYVDSFTIRVFFVSVTYPSVSLTYPIYFINYFSEKLADTAGIRIRRRIRVSDRIQPLIRQFCVVSVQLRKPRLPATSMPVRPRAGTHTTDEEPPRPPGSESSCSAHRSLNGRQVWSPELG